MTKKQTQIITVGVVAVIVILASAYFFGIKGQFAKKTAFEAEADLAVSTTTSLAATLTDLQRKEAEIGDAQGEYTKLATQFPEDFELSNWLRVVQATAAATGVTLESLAPATPTLGGSTAPAIDPATGAPVAAAGDLATSAITLAAKGTRADVQAFIQALGKMERPLLIDTLTISGDDNEVSLAISGKTFLIRGLLTPEQEQELRDAAAAEAAEEAAELAAEAQSGTTDPAAADPTATQPPVATETTQ